MAHYTFIDAQDNRRVFKAPMSRAPELARRLVRLGWRRLYAEDVSIIIVPGYFEAKAESADLYRQAKTEH